MWFYEEKNRKHNFREIVRKNQRYKLVSTEKIKLLYRNWNWHLEKKDIKKLIKRKSRSQSPKRKTVLEDWYIIPEVCNAKELIYNAHTSHGSHLKVYPHIEKCWRQDTDGIICLSILETFILSVKSEE